MKNPLLAKKNSEPDHIYLPFTKKDVLNALSKKSKSCDNDKITYEMLANLSPTNLEILWNIINLMLETGFVLKE